MAVLSFFCLQTPSWLQCVCTGRRVCLANHIVECRLMKKKCGKQTATLLGCDITQFICNFYLVVRALVRRDESTQKYLQWPVYRTPDTPHQTLCLSEGSTYPKNYSTISQSIIVRGAIQIIHFALFARYILRTFGVY